MSSEQQARDERIRRLGAEIVATRAEQPLEGKGRGIVVVAGGALIFTNAYVLVSVLRKALGSRLPVELWHFGPAEISPAMAALVEPLDVRLVDTIPLIAATGARIRDGWQLKSLALAHSRFAEVLLLDADQVPVSDPAACFDWAKYRETGAVFWPDLIDLRADNPVWQLLGLPQRRTTSLESGQILVDRRRHGAALAAALRLNEAADDLYQLIYGDKDTYLLAWEMLRAPYSLVPHPPYGDEFLLVQRDFDGAPLFQHRSNAKWRYGSEQRAIAGFRHEDACRTALAELERRWGGHVFTAPDRSARARAVEQALIAAGPWLLEMADEAVLTVDLLPHAEIGGGRAEDRRNWWVEEADGAERLVLAAAGRRCYVLERGSDGIWRGLRHRQPALAVALLPTDLGEPAASSDVPGLVDDLLRAGGLFGPEAGLSAQLTDAMDLLAAVIPGVRDRLLHLAAREPDPAIAERLRGLAERIGPRAGPAATDRSLTIATRYVRAETTG